MELSYFPEVLVCETDSSVGGKRFVFRAANSPQGFRGLCIGLLCSTGRAMGKQRHNCAAEFMESLQKQGGRDKLSEQTARNAFCRWRDGWTDGQAQHRPVRVPEGLRKYCVLKEGLCTPRMLLRGGAASSPSQRWGNWGTKHFSN